MKKLYLATIASNLGMLSYGLCFGWASPSLPVLLQDDSPIRLTAQQATWVTSFHTIGGTIGSLLCYFILNVIGRKWSLLLTAIPAVIGWMMIALATSAWELMAGRFSYGLSTGYGYISATVYMGEISPANIRGILTSTLTIASKLGVFIEWTIGPFLSLRNLALVSSLAPIIFIFSVLWVPESPYQLMRSERHHQAIESLMQLRGSTDVSIEADAIEKSVKIDLANDTGLWELFRVSGNRKALFIVLGLVIIQQWSGSQAIMSYAELIFNATGDQLQGKYVTMILGAIQVVCTIFGTTVVDRFGRRPLLMISAFGTSVSTFLVGLFFFLQNNETDVGMITWLPATGSILYVIMYAFGLAALPFTVMSEVFPTNVKALGTGIGMFVCNGSAVIVTSIYQSIVEQYGIHAAFWLFSTISLSGVVFVFYYMPETKGKTLQEVQEQLHGR
ncbi:facilitated trehalose transporter Tret1 [Osmia lignaria lignaria]|uniref:facilitated trehalose transporter Tret1 n=1 Tax=Osmia lignaria lignaria TaxID=1437193 RepID=UPI00402B30FF